MNQFESLASKLNITLIDENFAIIKDYVEILSQNKDFTIKHGNIFDNGPGTLISPANSYGDLGDGIDMQYRDRFLGVESRFLNFIKNEHGGKLEIGMSQIIPTYDSEFPYIIFAPTVERFGELSSKENVYNAMKSILEKTLEFNILKSPKRPIKKLLIPGLGTGCGGLCPIESAKAINEGYNDVNDRYQEALKTFNFA